ncbi:MAG: TolC family protein [Candidatus Eisenbacteria bacterium]
MRRERRRRFHTAGWLAVAASAIVGGVGVADADGNADAASVSDTASIADASMTSDAESSADAATTAGATSTADVTSNAGPTGPLTLDDALSWALSRDPGLEALRLEASAVEAEAIGLDVRPNPELGLELENFAGSGGAHGLGGAEATLSLSQPIERGGKRSKRRAVGDHETNLALLDYGIARAERAAATKTSFIAALAAREQVALSEELVQVAEEMLASISRRVQAGSSSRIEESRARVELEISRIDLEEARREYEAARTRLASNWGGPVTPASFQVVGSLESVAPLPDLEELVAGLDRSPMLMRWDAEAERRQAVLELERAMARADLTIGSGVRYSADGDDVSLLVGIGMPLAIFDKNRGAGIAAERRIESVAAERAAERNHAATQLAERHHDLAATYREMDALSERALPEADAAFSAAREAFLRGAVRLTDVLDSERLLFELRSRHVAVAAAYQTAYTEIQRLLGAPVDRELGAEGGQPAGNGMGGTR